MFYSLKHPRAGDSVANWILLVLPMSVCHYVHYYTVLVLVCALLVLLY